MTRSLREEHKVRTSATLAAVALDLFTERGYDAVTVSQIAAAARVGERTLYRYFADKEDLLFAEDEDWRRSLRLAVEQQPESRSSFAVLRGASAVVARALEDRRVEAARRASVIHGSAALTARERAKHAAWESVLTEGLGERGVAPVDARLLSRIAVACFDEALVHWLAQDEPRRTLERELDAAFDRLSALVREDGP